MTVAIAESIPNRHFVCKHHAAVIFSEHCSDVVSAIVLQGVFLKPRFTRGTHTFDFPILLTQDYTNWRLVAGAYIVPPLTIYVAKRHIIRPLLRWRRLKQVWLH